MLMDGSWIHGKSEGHTKRGGHATKWKKRLRGSEKWACGENTPCKAENPIRALCSMEEPKVYHLLKQGGMHWRWGLQHP